MSGEGIMIAWMIASECYKIHDSSRFGTDVGQNWAFMRGCHYIFPGRSIMDNALGSHMEAQTRFRYWSRKIPNQFLFSSPACRYADRAL